MSKVRIYNKTLCPLLWHGMKLDREARIHLLQIAKDFYEKTEFKAPVLDIFLMGSAANYNWTPESDVDIHVLISFKQLQMPEDTAEKAVKTAASAWNNEHVIRIKGHKVEMNLQSAEDKKPHVTGMYSLVKDTWVRKPQRDFPNVNRVTIVSKYTQLKDYIEKAIQSSERDYMKSVKEYVDAFRQYGLDTKGELSMENLVFKILRSRGILKKLKNAITVTYDKQMSVNEITQINLKTMHSHPAVSHNIKGLPDFSVMTLENLKALKEKVERTCSYLSGRNSPDEIKSAIRMWNRINIEIKRRLEYINKSVKEKLDAKKISVNEITQKDIQAHAPSPSATFGGDVRMDRMNMGQLMHLKKKTARFIKAHSQDEDSTHRKHLFADYIKFNKEIKRRMEYINNPVDEGYGAGIPETDRLHISGERWRIRSKDAPKTPRMKKEEVIAGDGHEKQLNEGFEDDPYTAVVYALLGYWAAKQFYNLLLDPQVREKIVKNWGLLKNDAKALLAFIKIHISGKNEGFDPTSAGPNPQATEGQPPDPNFYQDQIDKMQQMEGISLKELLMESPKMDKLKKHRQSLTDAEKKTVVSAGAVWEDGKPGIWKSVVDGKTWYVCNTHRCYQCKPTLKGAIRAFKFVKTTS